MGVLHDGTQIGAHGFPQADVTHQNFLILRPETPYFVAGACLFAFLAGLVDNWLVGGAVAVDAHDRAEGSELEPPHKQFLEGGVIYAAAVESANVGRPPGDAGQPHVQPGANLFAEIFPGGEDIPAPYQRAIALAANPGAAGQADNVGPAFPLLAFIEHFGILTRVNVTDFGYRPGIIAVVVIIIGGKLGLGFIQPEGAHPERGIILADLVPYIGPGAWVGGVKKDIVAMEHHLDIHAGVGFDQQAKLFHLGIIFAAPVNLRPDRNHGRDPHFVQLPDHLGRGGEILGVKAVIAAAGPVVVVNNQHIQRDAPALIFPRYVKHLLLVVIPQLALPESQPIFRHHRGTAGHFGVVVLDLFRGVAGRDPVIELAGAFSLPLGGVQPKMHFAHRGIVPKEPVPLA